MTSPRSLMIFQGRGRMICVRSFTILALALTVARLGCTLAADSPLPVEPAQVLKLLNRTVDWYHHLEPLQQIQVTSDDAISRDRLHQQSLTALRLGFDFGRAAAKLVPSAAPQTAQPGSSGNPPGSQVSAGRGATSGGTGAAASATGGAGSSSAGGTPAGDSAGGSNTGGSSADGPDAGSFAAQLQQSSDRLDQRVAGLQAQLSALDSEVAQATGPRKTALSAQRESVAAALTLAREVQDSLDDMQRFQESALLEDSSGQGGLAAQVDALQKSIPEAAQVGKAGLGGESSVGAGGSRRSASRSPSGGSGSTSGSSGASGPASGASNATPAAPVAAAPAPAAASNTAPQFRPESAGVIALATEWFSLHGTRSQITASIKETTSLLAEVASLRTAITAAVRTVVGSAFAATATSDPAQLTAKKAALEAGTATFRQLSTVLVPLGEQGLTLETSQNTLEEWRNSLQARSATVSRYLALKLGFLIASVAVVLAISEIWRRATFRYLHDSRRRRQFLMLRRVAVGIALTLVIVFGLVSELGSIATYAGFVTAGIAVALQNVILAIVAYFFLIGRYGVRVGDRITLAGVTGRVVEIGLVRIYLMELAGTELHATGRIVVLSNAVLFQPTALFKQIPGAEYVWHTVTLTIAASADVNEAQKRLKSAADSVYETYRPSIARQYEIVQKLVDFETTVPQPQTRVQWMENGLECSIRYPVEPENSASVDQRMLQALRDALAKEPPLTLVTKDALSLKASD